MEKLFVASEIDYIQKSTNPLKTFWQLWSVKESAYKAWQCEAGKKPVFNPIAFRCHKKGESHFSVNKKHFKCEVEVRTTSNYIYAAVVSDRERMSSKIFQSSSEYQNFISQLKDDGWLLEKDENAFPYFRHRTRYTKLLLSLTHDKEWHAIQLDQDGHDLLFNKHNHIEKQIKQYS